METERIDDEELNEPYPFAESEHGFIYTLGRLTLAGALVRICFKCGKYEHDAASKPCVERDVLLTQVFYQGEVVFDLWKQWDEVRAAVAAKRAANADALTQAARGIVAIADWNKGE